MAVDFTGAVLRDDEDLARSFVAPDHALDLPALRRQFGPPCRPDTYTARWRSIAADRAVVRSGIYYAEAAITLDIVFHPFAEGWRIVAVKSVDSG